MGRCSRPLNNARENLDVGSRIDGDNVHEVSCQDGTFQ